MDFENLTPEQQAKVEACETPEELIALAQDEGYELTDEQLEAMAGGNLWGDIPKGSGFSDPFVASKKPLE